MGLLDRFLSARRAGYEAAAAEWARGSLRAGQEADRPVTEQVATRVRPVTELDGQRQQGASPHAQ